MDDSTTSSRTESSGTTSTTIPPVFDPSPAPDGGFGHNVRMLVASPLAWILGIPLVIMAIVAVVFAFWTRPYYALAPGSVRETTERVEVNGADVFLPRGEIGFVTVSLVERVTMWEYIRASLDESVDLVPEEVINGDGTAEEKREEDRRRMQDSKDDATVVALEYLGYEVPRVGLGVEVAGLIECMPAEGVLVTGDLILSVDNEPTPLRIDLVNILGDKEPGDSVELRVDRITDGSIELVTLDLGRSDDPCLPAPEGEAGEAGAEGQPEPEPEPLRPMLGISLAQADLVDFDLPIDVQIDSDRVGGPSAGLAFTLAIMDVLTEGELTGDTQVATTGTINLNGDVGPVGGVKQKTVAARDAGTDLFLVPMNEEADSKRIAGDSMVVVGVENLSDALTVLSEFGGNGLEVAADALAEIEANQ